MTDRSVDVLVVGGGIHGVGVAQAAAAAGHSVLLLEARAVAAGTSSRSSKLIHGGLRYLESWQLRLVRESLAERELLLRLAPELVRLVPFHVPIYRSTRRRPWEIRAGLSLYALLGGLSAHARFRKVPRAEWEDLDGLRLDGLQAVFCYHDGQTDDAALSRAVLRSALELGATAEVGAELVEARLAGGRWSARLRRGDAEERADAAVLVNAAGPWANEVMARLRPAPAPRAVDLVGGAHVELAGELRRGIYYAEAPADGRAVFTMPWKGHTLVGTTETPYDGDPAAIEPTGEEIRYLEDTLHHYFPTHAGERIAAWAGLRVLPRGTGRAFDRPREVMLHADDPRAPRVLTIYGGKLTGYRSTAEKVLARLAPALPRRRAVASTRELRLTPVG